jgi:hypothetical protein
MGAESARNAKTAEQIPSVISGYHTNFPVALNGNLYHIVCGAKRNKRRAQILFDDHGEIIIAEQTGWRNTLSIVRDLPHLDVLLAYHQQHSQFAIRH